MCVRSEALATTYNQPVYNPKYWLDNMIVYSKAKHCGQPKNCALSLRYSNDRHLLSLSSVLLQVWCCFWWCFSCWYCCCIPFFFRVCESASKQTKRLSVSCALFSDVCFSRWMRCSYLPVTMSVFIHSIESIHRIASCRKLNYSLCVPHNVQTVWIFFPNRLFDDTVNFIAPYISPHLCVFVPFDFFF